MEEGSFDEIFTQVAGRLGGIQPLLDNFFGFLCRKTDFYVQFDPKKTKQAHMGFPPGVAESMVLNSFKKYPFRELDSAEGPNQSSTNAPSSDSILPSPPVVSKAKPLTDLNSDPSGTGSKCGESSGGVPSNNCRESNTERTELAVSKMHINPENGKLLPIGNGGYTENYYWTQTVKELTVYVDVPRGTRGKDIKVDLRPRHVSLSISNSKGEKNTLLDGEFEDVIRLDESMWTVASDHNSTQVIFTLDKVRNTWWKHVLEGDPEIDTTKVDSQQKMDEYDEETQATIRKLMFDQKQKRLGLPTSDETLAENMLEKAKNLPGSPFIDDTTLNSRLES